MDSDLRPATGGSSSSRDRPDLEKRLGATPAAEPPAGDKADTDPPKLLIVRKADAPAPGRDPSGPWHGSHFQTTTIKASAIPSRLTTPAPPPPAAAATPAAAPPATPAAPARPGLQLQQRSAPREEPEDNRATLPRGKLPADLAASPAGTASLHFFRVLASLLLAVAALFCIGVLMLQLGGALLPDPAWRSYLIWGMSLLLVTGLLFRLEAVQLLSGILMFTGALAMAGAIAVAIGSEDSLPAGLAEYLIPFSHAVALTFFAAAALLAATGQGWFRFAGIAATTAVAGTALVLGGLLKVPFFDHRQGPAQSGPAVRLAIPGGTLVATDEFQFSLPPEWLDRRSPDAPALPDADQAILFSSSSSRVTLHLTRRPVPSGFDPSAEALNILAEYRQRDEASAGIVIDVADPGATKRVYLISGEHTTEVVVKPARKAVYILSFQGSRTDIQQERAAIDRIIETFQPR